jgi:hypothetical protein
MAVYVPLPGSKRALLPNSRPAGPVDSSEITTVTVRVRSRGKPQDLAKMAYDLASQPLADRKYLTHDQLENQHGASQDDLDRIEHFAQERRTPERTSRRSSLVHGFASRPSRCVKISLAGPAMQIGISSPDGGRLAP